MNSIGTRIANKATLALVLCLLSTVASADEIVLFTSDSPIEGTTWNQGWWSNTASNANTTNVSTLIGVSNGDHRAFFTFFVPSTLSGSQLVSATLLQGRGVSSVDNESQETIGLFDVSTNAAGLNHNVGSSTTIYADLGAGTSFGQFNIAGNGPGDIVLELPLNAAGVLDLTAHAGDISRSVPRSCRIMATTFYLERIPEVLPH